MDYREHLNRLTCQDVESASKALDYYDGLQLKWLESLLNDDVYGVKNWQSRGVYPITDNFTKKVVSRSALSYQSQPERTVYKDGSVDETATELYNSILKQGEVGNVTGWADKTGRLLKSALVLVQFVDERNAIAFDVLHRANCDVDWDYKNKRVRSLMYTSGACGIHEGRMYHYWCDDYVQDIEVAEANTYPSPAIPHKYGGIPLAVLYDEAPPRCGFWPKDEWGELIRLNEAVNLYHTEVKFAERMQNFPALFSNARIADGQVIGADAVVHLDSQPGQDVFLEYRSPTVNLTEFEAWIQGLMQSVGDSWGVNLRFGGSGSADSGFKLVVEETWNLETREARINQAKVFESQLYKAVLAVSQAHQLGLPDNSEVYADFAEPSLAADTTSQREQDRKDVAAGLKSKEQVWREQDPDLTDEDIAARKMEIDGGSMPDFGDIDAN